MVIGKPNEAYKEMVAAMATVSKPKRKMSQEELVLQKLKEHKLFVMMLQK